MNNLETLFRYVQERGGTVRYDEITEDLDLTTPVPQILFQLKERDGVAILRLNQFLEPLPVRNMSKRQIGLQTEYLRIIVNEPQEFLHRSNGQSESEKVVDEILANQNSGFLLPCRRPLEPAGKCYHGPKCANGHKCPVAVEVRRYRRYDDRRVQVREQLESQGYKGGWRFTIEDVFGNVSEKTTAAAKGREEREEKQGE